MSTPAPRPGIQGIDAYVPGRSSVAGLARVIKLSANESALGPSPRAVAAYREAADDIARYPDGASSRLREALGRHFGLDPAAIVCGNGSGDLINLIAQAYAGPGEEVIHSRHGFLLYPIAARAAGASPVAAKEENLRSSVEAILARVSPRTRIVFLANPNNPTGTYLTRDELSDLRARLREDVLLVIDAAYAEFSDAPDYAAGHTLVDGGANVVMTRSFSKFFALAGLRIGWAYCPRAVADAVNRIRGPFNVSLPAQAAGASALEDRPHQEASKAHNDRWLAWLAEELRRLGLEVTPSIANFVLARFAPSENRSAEAANEFLLREGIVVRKTAAYGLPDCLRITVGREHEMHALRDALARFSG